MKRTAENGKRFFLSRGILETAAVFAVLFGWNLFFNRDVKIASLYMDDLANYWYYLRMNFREYAFGVAEGQLHYRPVFFGLLYGVCALITGHLERIILWNNFLQAICGTLLYRMLRKLSVSPVLSFGLSFVALCSRLSYFVMGQMIGLIESVSAIFALLILDASLSYLYKDYGTEKGDKGNVLRILLCYFLVSMTHERFIGLLVPIFLVFLLKDTSGAEKRQTILAGIGVFGLILLIRYLALHSVIPVGTSHTDVTETFTISGAFGYAVDELLMIFGISRGPEHLVGQDFMSTALWMKALVLISALFMLLLFFWYAAAKITEKKDEKGIYGRNFRIDAVFITSVMMYIGSSSVTVRLEMRWVYVSLFAVFLYGGYMIVWLRKHTTGKKAAMAILLIAAGFLGTRFAEECYYHKSYQNIFFYNDLIAANSLAEETVGSFTEEELADKTVYLTSNTYAMDGKFWSYFYEPFYGKRNEDGHWVINTVDWVTEQEGKTKEEVIKELLSDEDAILLEEVPESHTYRRVK